MCGMRLSIATKVFLGFVAVLACSAAVSVYGIVRLQRIGRGLSLLSRPYMPLTRAVSTLEAFQKERERSTDRLLDEQDPKARANLIPLAASGPSPNKRAAEPSRSRWTATRHQSPAVPLMTLGASAGSRSRPGHG